MNFDAEWLETDGRGGFASGTVGGARSRRYHALLLPATRPPVGRVVLVNGLEVWLETPAGRWPLSTQCYPGGLDGQDVLSPRGQDFLVDFQPAPWPRWTYQFPDGTRIEQEIFVHQSTGLTALVWRLPTPSPCKLELRPLLSGRDYHALHQENGAFAMDPVAVEANGGNVLWQPYAGVPGVRVWSSGTYRHEPTWYRHFLYTWERARGLDDTEDLAVPGVFVCDLSRNGTAAMLLGSVETSTFGVPIPRRFPSPPARATSCPPCARTRNAAGASSATRSCARAAITSCAAPGARRSSRVIRGSRTGVGTRSSPCAACAWPPDASTRRARSCCRGPTPFPKA